VAEDRAGDQARRRHETPIPTEVRALLDAPNYVHLATLRADGSPRNHVVWVGLEGAHVLICTSDVTWEAKDIPVALSVIDRADPYRMAMLQGRMVQERPDEGCRYMDPISRKYTGAPFPSRGSDRVCSSSRSSAPPRERWTSSMTRPDRAVTQARSALGVLLGRS
jgi:hypothetical protein